MNSQQMLNADAFYALRDSRMGTEYPLKDLPAKHIAIVVPPDVKLSEFGVETALFWSASIIRRMGRPFAEVVLVASHEFWVCESQLAATPKVSVEQLITHELKSADPFAPFELRKWSKDLDLAETAAVIWLGNPPLGVSHTRMLSINAHGWIAILREIPNIELLLAPADFDAAPATIILATCMAAARLFSEAFNPRVAFQQIAFALDGAGPSCDPVICAQWLAKGASFETIVPWKPENGSKPSLEQLLIVSAGGIGGNFCTILGQSYFHTNIALVLDPDNFDISNLNRAIGVGLELVDRRYSKALFAANSLRCADNISAVQSSYESWITPELVEQLQQTGTSVVIGVDQVQSRLTVGSDWPWMILNGGTSGTTFSTSIHARQQGGCIGCWYGQSEASFAATRQPMACAAGVNTPVAVPRQVASYPFVSIAAAAQMVAMLTRAVYQNKVLEYAGTVTSMSLSSPENAQVRKIQIDKRCLLLCSESYLQPILGRKVD